MKDTIYTIPVMDALREDTECAFCSMKKKLENDAIDFILSPSYMEVDVRGKTNALGFCKTHIEQLYHKHNHLGVALILQSHLDVKVDALKKAIEEEMSTASPKSFGLFGKKNTEQKNPVEKFIEEHQNSCYICDSVEQTFNRYLETFFFLYKKDDEAKNLVKNSKGFCFEHFSTLVTSSRKHLSGKTLDTFLDTISSLQIENLNRVAEDLDWYTKKFDYRYQKEPWKNAQDSVKRTILKLNAIEVNTK